MIGTSFSRFFALRSIVFTTPYRFLFLFGSIIIVAMSFMLKIIEGPVFLVSKRAQDGNNDLRYFYNCIWNVLVTMTTVGYGDYYPSTNLGRLINITAAILGTILVSLIVISLQNSLKLSENEQKAYEEKERVDMEGNIKLKAAKLFKASFFYLNAKKKYTEAIVGNKPEKDVGILKRHVEKSLYHLITTKRDFRKYIHKFRSTFETPCESDLLKSKLDEIQKDLSLSSNTNEVLEENVKSINTLIDKIERLIEQKKKANN